MCKLIRYPNLRSCIIAMHQCDDINDIKGYWTRRDAKGNYSQVSWSDAFEYLTKNRSCWGWTNRKEIHVWVDSNAKRSTVIRLLAHELGHAQHPRLVSGIEEEQKANRYGDTAKAAFEMTENLMKGDHDGTNTR